MKKNVIALSLLIASSFLSVRIDDGKTNQYHQWNTSGAVAAAYELSPAYNRKNWPHWTDDDRDCQNTRMEILLRDNIGLIKYKRNNSCSVTWGKWICPYTGKEISKASDLDIDHLVPLAHAHKSGGAGWSTSRKREFANDPLNLLAVEDDINREKGDQGPDEWRPPRKTFWPEYARRWRAVKKKYGLHISPAEEAALRDMEL